MFEKYETLKKLDSVIITNKEFDTAYVWNQHLHKDHLKTKIKKLVAADPV